MFPTNPRANIHVDEAQHQVFREPMAAAGIEVGIQITDDACFYFPDGTHFNDVFSEEMRKAIKWGQSGLMQVIVKPDNRHLLIGGREVPYQGIVIDFEIAQESRRGKS